MFFSRPVCSACDEIYYMRDDQDESPVSVIANAHGAALGVSSFVVVSLTIYAQLKNVIYD